MAGKPKPDSIRETAKRLTGEMGFPVSKRMVEEWKKKGYPLKDPKALERRLRNQEALPRGMPKKKAKPKPEASTPPETPTEGRIEETRVERELGKLHADLLAAEDYETARTIKIKIEGVKKVLEELREAGRYVLKSETYKDASRAALAVRGELEKLEDGLPPLLEGLSALQMKAKIRDYSRGLMLELSRLFS